MCSHFRALWEGGYKTYAHLADVTTFDVLHRMAAAAPGAPGVSRAFAERLERELLAPGRSEEARCGWRAHPRRRGRFPQRHLGPADPQPRERRAFRCAEGDRLQRSVRQGGCAHPGECRLRCTVRLPLPPDVFPRSRAPLRAHARQLPAGELQRRVHHREEGRTSARGLARSAGSGGGHRRPARHPPNALGRGPHRRACGAHGGAGLLDDPRLQLHHGCEDPRAAVHGVHPAERPRRVDPPPAGKPALPPGHMAVRRAAGFSRGAGALGAHGTAEGRSGDTHPPRLIPRALPAGKR